MDEKQSCIDGATSSPVREDAAMAKEESVRDYLGDLGTLLLQLALAAKTERDSVEGEDRVYATGRLMGLHEAVSLMQRQANAYGIDYQDIGLADVEPERELM